MRVLLDENVDRRLRRFFDDEHEVTSVPRVGWSGKKDGELLDLAQREFDVFVTTDRGIPDQQNFSALDLAVVVLEAKSNTLEDLTPLMERVNAELGAPQPGTPQRISNDS